MNSKGDEIAVLRCFPATALEASEHPLHLTLGGDNFRAARRSPPTGGYFRRRGSAAAVLTVSGAMDDMTTGQPLTFVRIKQALMADWSRDPRNAPKDTAQADMVPADHPG